MDEIRELIREELQRSNEEVRLKLQQLEEKLEKLAVADDSKFETLSRASTSEQSLISSISSHHNHTRENFNLPPPPGFENKLPQQPFPGIHHPPPGFNGYGINGGQNFGATFGHNGNQQQGGVNGQPIPNYGVNYDTYLASADTIMQSNSTETIRNSIIDIFQIFETTKISKLFDEDENLNTTVHFTLKNTTLNVHLHQLHVHKQRFPFLNMYCNFSNGNLHFTSEELTISINGTIQNPDNSSKNHCSLNWTATLKAVLIKITGLFTNLSNEELPIDVSFRKFCEDFPYEIYNESLHSSKPAIADQKLMEKSLTPKMISLVRKYLITRGRKLLNEFLRQNVRTNYFSNHSKLLENHHRYEYFIPNVSSIWFDLTNITIFGLANFKSFNAVVKKDDSFIGALLMRDIEGTMILDYGSLIEAPMELNFNASCVEILIKRSGDRVYVEAQNYKITPTMSDHRSAVIMQRIEYAIAASIWPSMNVFWKEHQLRRIYDPESPHRKTDWNTIAQLFNKSIPFDYNPPTNITTTVVSNCIEQKAQKFDISFHNMTVKLTLGNHYPKKIECEFLDSLKVNYEMKTNPTENISLHNNGNIISINFHVNFTSIIFSTTGSNNSRINNICEVYNIPTDSR